MGGVAIFTNGSKKLIWKENKTKEENEKERVVGRAGESVGGITKQRTKREKNLAHAAVLYFEHKCLQVVTIVIFPLLLPSFLSELAHKSVEFSKQIKLLKVSLMSKPTMVTPQHPHHCNEFFLFFSAARILTWPVMVIVLH